METVGDQRSVSVLIATFNRAEILRQTLEAMCAVDREGLDVEFVVIDNNSTDNTNQVIDSFAERLRLRHLFEPRPGKNCALNHALDTVELGGVVVLTDDDVAPRGDWLQQIAAACERWPEYDVFGGRIELIWPAGVEVPRWATENAGIREMGFGEHHLGTEAKPYQYGSKPSGANFWVRGKVFRAGARYDESSWTRPGQRFCMGDESELLARLAASGRRTLYVPGSVIGHHVQVSLLDSRHMVRRAIRYGRGGPHIGGMPDPEELARHPWHWRMRRILAMAWYGAGFLRAQLHRDQCLRMQCAVEALRGYAYHREALHMSLGAS